MNSKNIINSIILYIVLTVFVLNTIYGANYVLGQMSGGTYKIQSDSINFGGSRSSSAIYTGEDTGGEIATGDSASTNYKVKAGFQQMQDVYLSVSSASSVNLSPNIGGITGGTADGSTSFTVVTDNPAGYTVTIKASSSPALNFALDSFADYSATASSPDFSFSIPASASAFAFTAEGTDIASSFKDNGVSCATGSSDTVDKCWAGLSTSNQTIVNRASANTPAGTLTTIKFRAQSGSSHVQTNGTYTATTTVTVLSL
jgi:hypothetical protein